MARSAKRAGPKTQAPASGARWTLQPPPSPPLMKGNLGVAKALAKGPPGGALMHGMGLQTQWGGGWIVRLFFGNCTLRKPPRRKRNLCSRPNILLTPGVTKEPGELSPWLSRALLAVWGKAGLALSHRDSWGLPCASDRAAAGRPFPGAARSILPDPAWGKLPTLMLSQGRELPWPQHSSWLRKWEFPAKI